MRSCIPASGAVDHRPDGGRGYSPSHLGHLWHGPNRPGGGAARPGLLDARAVSTMHAAPSRKWRANWASSSWIRNGCCDESDYVSLHVPLARIHAAFHRRSGTGDDEAIRDPDQHRARSRGGRSGTGACSARGGSGRRDWTYSSASRTCYPELLDADAMWCWRPTSPVPAHETRRRMSIMAAENAVAAVVAGSRPPNLLNPDDARSALGTTEA